MARAMSITIRPVHRSISDEEMIEDIIDMILYYIDANESPEEAEKYLNSELTPEYPGHSAVVRGEPDGFRVVISGPKHAFRCTVKGDSLDLEL